MARFVSIPLVETGDIPPGQAIALNAIKENVELLAGIRNPASSGVRAIRKEEVRVSSISPSLKSPIGEKRMSVKGESFGIKGEQVPSMSDFVRLINDVVECKQDVIKISQELTEIKQTLSTLIEQLRN